MGSDCMAIVHEVDMRGDYYRQWLMIEWESYKDSS